MNIPYILLVEDSVADIMLVQQALSEHDISHNLHIVQDGAEALDFVARIGNPGGPRCPDLLLLDLNLPKIDGAQILSCFRRHPECVSTPVIVVSSSDALKDRSRVAGFDISHYFRKPSDLDEFLHLGTLVRRLLQSLDGPGGGSSL